MRPRGMTRTSISTIAERITISAALIAIAVLPAVAQSRPVSQNGQQTLEQDVRRLGSPGNDDFADVKRLARLPAESAGLLVAQLHVLKHPERTIVGQGSPEFERVLWSFLALRYITGSMDFCAPTNWRPRRSYEDGIRNYWLHFENKSCVTFFAVWPSRGRYYVAPLDAQRKIISAWQRWYGEQGKQFDYEPLVNPESWQWTEGVQKVVNVGRADTK
jgi:hypothetical protein